MYKIDFNKPIHIHFIGIGGISMSGLPHNPPESSSDPAGRRIHGFRIRRKRITSDKETRRNGRPHFLWAESFQYY